MKVMQTDLIADYLSDLERFTLKIKDIYLIYYDMELLKIYCEFGYHQQLNCKKNIK